MALTFTGERFLPSCEGEMIYEHWHRYLFAKPHVVGKRVLDVASGEGYGSALLATGAASVTGVDVSEEAVQHARRRYGANPNLRFECASCTSLPFLRAEFDVIVSFETIEHITEQEAFVREVDRLLAPDGLFIISSPNRPEYSDRTGYRNEFHVKELNRPELKTLLDTHFPAQRWFAQRPCFQSLMWPLEATPEGAQVLAIDGCEAYPAELYFLVCCSRHERRLDEIRPAISLVTDRSHSVYSEWSRTYAENRSLGQSLAALELEVARLRECRAPQYSLVQILKGLVRKLLPK
jgi:SAM-dependent methyltransferase